MSTNNLAMVLLLVLINFTLTDAQFTTHFSEALDKLAFKKGAAFVFKYQTVTPESEIKIRVFSTFPRIPNTNSKDANTILETRGYSNPMDDMNTVERCQTETLTNLYKQLLEQLEDQLAMSEKGTNATQNDQEQIKRTAVSFIPPPIEHHDPSRSKRALALIAAATVASELVLGAPATNAACSAISIFGVRTDNKELEKNVDAILAKQHQFYEVLQRVQRKIDENFFLLGNEVSETPDTVMKLTEVVSDQLRFLESDLL